MVDFVTGCPADSMLITAGSATTALKRDVCPTIPAGRETAVWGSPKHRAAPGPPVHRHWRRQRRPCEWRSANRQPKEMGIVSALSLAADTAMCLPQGSQRSAAMDQRLSRMELTAPSCALTVMRRGEYEDCVTSVLVAKNRINRPHGLRCLHDQWPLVRARAQAGAAHEVQ